ncbi:hypothetical protein EVAR_67484_1 [Eumeta japonica]|uniref:Uncharacterized protein n=1 Tax=Eumeta variegata TaxID=151549 RepID=A0A4C1ZH57_EUMVA|nr:hypothetical protein EVAR_67484_1 [Eumeta japonica]
MNMLTHHFEQCHPELCAAVDAERALPGSALRRDQTLVFLLTVGVCHFVLRIEVHQRDLPCRTLNLHFDNVQCVPPGGGRLFAHGSAALRHAFQRRKWVYELHVYNKAEPRRKYHYNGSAPAITAPCAPAPARRRTPPLSSIGTSSSIRCTLRNETPTATRTFTPRRARAVYGAHPRAVCRWRAPPALAPTPL